MQTLLKTLLVIALLGMPFTALQAADDAHGETEMHDGDHSDDTAAPCDPEVDEDCEPAEGEESEESEGEDEHM